jgi:His/Glu/Gln/Arg/opine family amino acid ABC transporter permease subunit
MAATFIDHAREFLPILLQGAVVTVQVTILSFLLSSVIGLALALIRRSPIKPIAWAGATVVNVIRGLPIIVQLFYIYFVLPDLGIQLTAVPGRRDRAGHRLLGLSGRELPGRHRGGRSRPARGRPGDGHAAGAGHSAG